MLRSFGGTEVKLESAMSNNGVKWIIKDSNRPAGAGK